MNFLGRLALKDVRSGGRKDLDTLEAEKAEETGEPNFVRFGSEVHVRPDGKVFFGHSDFERVLVG